MSKPEPLAPELKGLEEALSALLPQSARIDRDQVMYEAGRSARPRHHGAWSAALAGCAALTLIVGRWTAPTLQLEPQDSLAVAPAPSTHEDADAAARLADPASYFQLRRQAGDVDAVFFNTARATSVSVPDVSDRNTLLRELLN